METRELTGNAFATLSFQGPGIAKQVMNRDYLGMSFESKILIDDDAAGWGWSFDTDMNTNPNTDRSSRQSMDLLTVVLHELGHQLGFEDDHDTGDDDTLMDWSVDLNEVRIPVEAHSGRIGKDANQLLYSENWHSCVDNYFSEWDPSSPRKRRAK